MSNNTNGDGTHVITEDDIFCEVKVNVDDVKSLPVEITPDPIPEQLAIKAEQISKNTFSMFSDSTPSSQNPKDSLTVTPSVSELPEVPEMKQEMTKPDETTSIEAEVASRALSIPLEELKDDTNKLAELTASPASASSSSQTKKHSQSKDKDKRHHSQSYSDDKQRRKSRERERDREHDKSRSKTSSSSKHSSQSSSSKHRSSSSKYEKSSASTTSSRSNHESSTSKRSSSRHDSSTHKNTNLALHRHVLIATGRKVEKPEKVIVIIVATTMGVAVLYPPQNGVTAIGIEIGTSLVQFPPQILAPIP